MQNTFRLVLRRTVCVARSLATLFTIYIVQAVMSFAASGSPVFHHVLILRKREVTIRQASSLADYLTEEPAVLLAVSATTLMHNQYV